MKDTTRAALGLGGFVVGCLAAGAIGGLATAEGVGTWYKTIEKPSWNPPAWMFGPVWTTLYVMMAVSAWMVWRQKQAPGRKAALGLFALQLGLNTLWSFVFFGWHRIGWALAEMIVLWIAIVATMVAFFRIRRVAGWLLVPYLAWVSFATFLTWTIWTLNPMNR